jgi:large subunit ribosomal protein L13
MKVYDATNQVLGRLSTRVARELLMGETVHVVNCEKACISGNPEVTKEKYLKRRQRGDPHHGPFYPRNPKGLVRRTIRGMLPYKKPLGIVAFRRLKVWVGVPDELKKQELITLKELDVNKLKCKHITVEELSLWLGTEKRW